MKKLIALLFVFALPVMADPPNTSAQLQAYQSNVLIDSGGVFVYEYPFGMRLTTSTVDAATASLISSCAVLHSDIATLTGGTLGPNVPFDTAHNGNSVSVTAPTGGSDTTGGVTPPDAQLTEGPNLKSSGTLHAGNGGTSVNFGTAGNGGRALLILDPSKTSWASITMTPGSSPNSSAQDGNGGNADLILLSTQTTGTLSISDNSQPQFAFTSQSGQSNITVAGGVLISLTLTYANNASAGTIGTHDYSGVPLNQASVDRILAQYAASAANLTGGSLVINGSCAAPSTAGADDAATAASYGLTVNTN